MPNGSRDGDVLQLTPLSHLTKQQPTATHVPAAHKLPRKEQSLAQRFHEYVRVLSRRDAAEQHDVFAPRRQQGDVSPQRCEVALARRTEVHFGERAEIVARDPLRWRDESTLGCDDQQLGAERARVRQLAAEIQATQKAEDFRDLDARWLAQCPRERELGPWIEDQLRALTVAARRGE